MTELTCREMVALVTEYLEDRLDPGERARFEAHLALCEGCTAYLDQMRRTIGALGQLSEDQLSPAAREDLLAAFRTWRTP
jgi:anti-sigma factor RsiW